MSELYHHLLIPREAVFVPELHKIAAFFDELESLGALPKEKEFNVITYTGATHAIARNANTGEVYYGPKLKVSRYPDLQLAIDSIGGEGNFNLSVEGIGPTTIAPFNLYGAHRPDVLWKGPYSFSLSCKLRQSITHFLHSSFGCKCDLKPDEPGIFENPWNNQPIKSGALGAARFWIEFGIGDWLMPMISDSLDILDTRLVASANSIFSVPFDQGCLCNDD